MGLEDFQSVGRELPSQRIEFHPLNRGELTGLLKIKEPILGRGSFKQLNYINRYVQHPDLGCKSVAIEHHYIDRDYMEDHGLFYSKSLRSYDNFCQRAHFFSLPASEVKGKVTELVRKGRTGNRADFLAECESFSRKYYLGFSVIKPLPGCPVGRTVLKTLGQHAAEGKLRRFSCTKLYKAHFAGIPLTVRGLAFQQQDAGVSACATTALWCALQKTRDLEDIGNSTPARITTLAGQFDLPFGRPIPSEGLSIGQMCVAVQALGVSPNLYRAVDFLTGRDLVFSSAKSGIASVLIVRGAKEEDCYHAITVVGLKLSPSQVPEQMAHGVATPAGGVLSFYVHDDRRGPYLRADVLQRVDELGLDVHFRADESAPEELDQWTLSHILIPMHAKVRLSFTALRDLALDSLIPVIQAHRKAHLGDPDPSAASFDNRICLSQEYIEDLLFDRRDAVTDAQLDLLRLTIPYSRYVGVIQFSAPPVQPIDVVLDTTSTLRNLVCLAVVPSGTSQATISVAECLAKHLECRLLAA